MTQTKPPPENPGRFTLLDRIENGEIKPDVIVSHHMSLRDAPKACANFKNKQDEFTKIVLQP